MDHAGWRLSSRTPDGATEPRLIIRTCKHILDKGRFCRAPAVNKRKYCHAHLRLRRCLWRMARAGPRITLVKLPLLDDAQAAQLAKQRVRVALADGRMDPDTAGILFHSLQMIATNFSAMERRADSRRQSRASPQDGAGYRYNWQEKGSWGG